MTQRCRSLAVALLAVGLGAAVPDGVEGSFAARELFVPGVGRTAGKAGSQWYSTLWITNASSKQDVDVEVRLLKVNQSNVAPATHTTTVQAGETVRFDNVVESLFGETATSGTLHIVASGDVVVASRTFDQASGTPAGASKGYFFAGIPASFALGLGESTLLQAVSQGGGEDFRFNFGLVETTGNSVAVRATLRSAAGVVLASKDYTLRPLEPRQFALSDLGAGAATANGVLEVAVTSGQGRVLVYGSLIANGSNDAAGLEMLYRSSELAANGDTAAASASGSAAATVTSVVDRLYQVLLEIQRHGSYNDATGWWSVSLTLAGGQVAQMEVRFEDAQGNPQKFFNPVVVTTVRAKGQASSTQGYVTFDLTITGTNTGSPNLVVNGSGTASYQGVSGTYTVTALVMPKSPGAYPTSGTVVVSVPPATLTVTFNGTQYAEGVYALGPATRTFTVDLATGEITWA